MSLRISIVTLVLSFIVISLLAVPLFAKDNKKKEGGDDYYSEEQAGGIAYDEEAVTLDKADIQRVIKKRYTSIRACYETQLQTNQKLSGKVIVNFSIQLSGTVKGVKKASGSTMKDKKVIKCVTKIMKSLRFPARKKGNPIEINYPFNFKPKNK